MNYAIYNPNNLPVDELPVIYGNNNGGSPGVLDAILLAEDGTFLGSHLCSHESFMYGDLGITEGTRADRHGDFQKHYPNGYRMDFVPLADAKEHEAFQRAVARHRARKCE
jgi:hypothetical protein